MMMEALSRLYLQLFERGEVPEHGFSAEKISFELVLATDGTPVELRDLRHQEGKKPRPRLLPVPTDPNKTRTSGILPFVLWDKTAYAFGVTAGKDKRTKDEHAAFKQRQHEVLKDTTDPDLRAYLAFVDAWRPSRFRELPGFTEEALDANFVFRMDGEHSYLHEKPEARALWTATLGKGEARPGQCLVYGTEEPLADGHPVIREVNGAQTAGAYLVSYNISAFESYGKKGNANASISRHAAFAYTTALNHLLRRAPHNRQRLQIGDATVVFWAEAPSVEATDAAIGLFSVLLQPPNEAEETAKLGSVLETFASGRPLASIDPNLHPDTRYYVLGLAPNAARLSVRFWMSDTLERLGQRFVEHYHDLRLEPAPHPAPSPWLLLRETAALGKSENVPPQLAGELMRAILTGQRYPGSLLANVVMRMRADRDVNLTSIGLRAAICRMCLVRDARKGVHQHSEGGTPVGLDPEERNPGYRLGRLFAALENLQRAALGRNINATIRERYYGSASATPASVFPLLLRGATHHFANVRKSSPGLAFVLEQEIAQIVDGLDSTFPPSLRLGDQGRFAIGYYQQKCYRRPASEAATSEADTAATTDIDQEEGE
ncbi:type I-C CRISPR-associated protein Cas8c/Csd1 [Myxococcus virescens]|uniref:CRISPR-associated protein, Csd1 family n=1 Tax=Myxococcus virescens TaxID=83456 RepID=A0A511HPI5_9BACT|nr:type I-C CRISPR-associated protein Cas8c/Csd1 [Myxococcus virescens]GEL75507.1 type I-C CRISPR-associated protein Cas8c/Csd1 [Myxococcus virescens]SDD48695.1 CRISPR-associated protein, Csd1 family [Myxococcus virescens]